MAFPREALPKDHFQGLGNLSTDEADSLRSLLNRVRDAAMFGGYQVDPDDDSKYPTINAAVLAGDKELLAGFPIPISLASGKKHELVDGALPLAGTRDVYLVAQSTFAVRGDHSGNGRGNTEVAGDITLAAADSAPQRLMLTLEGVHFNGDISGNSNWKIVFGHCHLQGGVTRTHGTNGCLLEMIGVRNYTAAFTLVDSDEPAQDYLGAIIIQDTTLQGGFPVAPTTLWSIKKSAVFIKNCKMWWLGLLGTTLTVFDLNNTASRVNIEGFTIGGDLAGPETLKLFANSGSATVETNEMKIVPAVIDSGVGFQVDTGGTPGKLNNGHGLIVQTHKEPVNPFLGMTWHDIGLNDKLVWDGTYWGVNGTYRENVLVDIGSAALDHDVGFDVPAGGAVVSTAFKLLKALTGAGGADRVGLGTGSGADPDKYAETASLAAGQKDQNLHGTFNDGGGDDLKITAETAPGTSGGTVAGSGDEDALAVVYFKLPKTLP